MTQKFRASERTEFSNGAIGWAPGGMADCLGPFAKVQNCPIADGGGLRLTCYATGYADTYFSVPAVTRYKGARIRGYFSCEDGGVEFRVMNSHAHLLPMVARNRALKAARESLETLNLESQA